jgi:hypothetical protein
MTSFFPYPNAAIKAHVRARRPVDGPADGAFPSLSLDINTIINIFFRRMASEIRED